MRCSFQNRPTTQWLTVQPQHNGGNLAFVGRNPTHNAVINYYLSDKVTGDVKFDVADIGSEATCTGTVAAKAGIGRVEWTMRFNTNVPPPPAGAAGRGGGGGGGRGGAGGGVAACLAPPNNAAPTGRGGGGGFGGGGGNVGRAQPGTYKVTMTANGKTYTSTITLKADPLGVAAAMSGGGSR
jgi:hypothetical protein